MISSIEPSLRAAVVRRILRLHQSADLRQRAAMNRPSFLAAVVIPFAGLACAKADHATNPPVEAPAIEAAESPAAEAPAHEEHEHDFPASVTSFHDAMSPLWHAEAGETRTQNTCAAVDDMMLKAGAIGEAGVPEKVADHADGWNGATADLLTKLEALKVTCADSPDAFDAGFKEVHEAFHVLVKIVGHEKH